MLHVVHLRHDDAGRALGIEADPLLRGGQGVGLAGILIALVAVLHVEDVDDVRKQRDAVACILAAVGPLQPLDVVVERLRVVEARTEEVAAEHVAAHDVQPRREGEILQRLDEVDVAAHRVHVAHEEVRLRHVEPRVDHHQRIVPPGGVTVGRAGDENHRVVLSGEAVALQRAGQRFAGQLRGGIDLIGRAGLRMRAGRKRAE